MPPFTFRLQTLLDQKLEAERAAKAAVVERRGALQEEQNKLRGLEGKEALVQQRVSLARAELLMPAGIQSSADIQRKNDYLWALQQDLKVAHDDVLIQNFAVEEAESALAKSQAHAAMCSREAGKLSKYRAKLESRYLALAAKKEELEQDELGTVMFLSRRAGR
jgi:flagellar biosynthesis chaperone FliJ